MNIINKKYNSDEILELITQASDYNNDIHLTPDHVVIKHLLSLLEATDDNYKKLLALDSYYLEYIPNPSEEYQILAVSLDASSIRLINNPSEAVQLAAIQKDSSCFMYIQDPSPKVLEFLINHNGRHLEFVKHPSYELKKLAINNDPYAIQYVYNQTEELQLLALKHDKPGILKHIHYDCNESVINGIINLPSFALEYGLDDHIKRMLRFYKITPEILSKLYKLSKNPKTKILVSNHPKYMDDAQLILTRINENVK